MFLHLSVSHSVHRGGEVYTPWADTPKQTSSPSARLTPRQTPPDGDCKGRYASYWNTFLLLRNFEKETRLDLTMTYAQVSSQGPGMPFCSNLFRRHQPHTEGSNYWKCPLRRVRRGRRVSETDLTLIALGISTLNAEVSDLLDGAVLKHTPVLLKYAKLGIYFSTVLIICYVLCVYLDPVTSDRVLHLFHNI